MKGLSVVGLLIAALGVFILIKGLTYKKSDTVLDVGPLKASVEERKAIPEWVGVAAIVGGLVLVGAGARRK